MISTGQKLLIFIPTYNEKQNVRTLISEIMQLNIAADIVFLDDNSPDGTGQILNELATSDSGLTVIHRSGKQGVGSAHLEGIKWAYSQSYNMLLTMDSDMTHDPQDIPRFLDAASDCDLVLGSRFQDKNSLHDWNPYRKWLTHLGHFLTKCLLRIPYDATGAFRLYRLDRISQRVFAQVESKSYSFFFESLFILHNERIRIKEIPIILRTRNYGSSKMSAKDIQISLWKLCNIYCLYLYRKLKLRLPKL